MQKSVSIAEACLMVDIDFTFNVSQVDLSLKPITQLIGDEFQDDVEYITNKIGNWSFCRRYEAEGVSKLEFLEFIQDSFQAKKDAHIQYLATQKLKEIAPKTFNCDPTCYALSKYYRTWFVLRESFFKQMHDVLARKNDDVYFFLWNTILDNNTPDKCKGLNDSIHNANADFILIANKHWSEVHEFCRCGIRYLSERQLLRRNLKAP